MYFFWKYSKKKNFKKSEKNLVTFKMERNLSSCSIGIWNYHLAPSKLKSRIFLCPYACPLCHGIYWDLWDRQNMLFHLLYFFANKCRYQNFCTICIRAAFYRVEASFIKLMMLKYFQQTYKKKFLQVQFENRLN